MLKRIRWLAIGAAVTYFGDPRNGARRRALAKDQMRAHWRRLVRRSERARAQASGRLKHLRHLREKPKEFDDATLADKVKSEVFRPHDLPKGDVNVNVADGVVELRGKLADPELIDELVSRVRRVHGVRDVHSFLIAREEPAEPS
jgi:osmotically-inducible protein OsmY